MKSLLLYLSYDLKPLGFSSTTGFVLGLSCLIRKIGSKMGHDGSLVLQKNYLSLTALWVFLKCVGNPITKLTQSVKFSGTLKF